MPHPRFYEIALPEGNFIGSLGNFPYENFQNPTQPFKFYLISKLVITKA
jgi:hypothetical protein